jgi:hypothetical protein
VGFDEAELINWYRLMLTIRRFDEKRQELAEHFPTPQQHPHFKAPIARVAAIDLPVPYGCVLEGAVIPQKKDIIAAVERVFKKPRKSSRN